MLKVSFPDGAIKEYSIGITPFQIAKSLSNSLAKNILSASFNGEIIELSTKLSENGSLKFYSWEDSNGKKAFWHSSAQKLAQVISELYPKSK